MSHKEDNRQKTKSGGSFEPHCDALGHHKSKTIMPEKNFRFCEIWLLQVEFQICESRKNNTKTAVNVKLLVRSSVSKNQGFIATLKDNFGFIETAEHDKEVFFHFR